MLWFGVKRIEQDRGRRLDGRNVNVRLRGSGAAQPCREGLSIYPLYATGFPMITLRPVETNDLVPKSASVVALAESSRIRWSSTVAALQIKSPPSLHKVLSAKYANRRSVNTLM